MRQPSFVTSALALAGVLLAALAVRLWGVGWDHFAALHPDERHLFFVSRMIFDALADPANAELSLSQWWFADDSPLNPHRGELSYVYGELPLFVAAWVARLFGQTDWFAFMPVARAVSSVVDTLAVLAVFLAARTVAPVWPALGAAVLYAAMPSALQLAGFHTVDVWLSATCAGALACAMALAQGHAPLRLALVAGIMGGLAGASKVTGILIAPPLLAAVLIALWRGLPPRRAGLALALLIGAGFVTFRLANPFAFAGPGMLGLWPSADWIADMRGLVQVTSSPYFPPNWVWEAGYGPVALARDLFLFGAGPVAVLVVLGLRRGDTWAALCLPAMGVLAFVLLTAFSSVSALRYASPTLPALAILCAPALARMRLPAALGALAVALWWGAGAARLHDGAHPRIEASHWLWTLPRGTVLTNETDWDDGLPTIVRLASDPAYRWPNHDDWFVLQRLDITAPDTPEKAERIAQMLAATDYLILSSDRQSAVMPRLPRRLPMTAVHYDELLSGRACFTLVRRWDRGYPLPGLRFDNSWAQEPWRIYDHPIVQVFQRDPCFDADTYAERLRQALIRTPPTP